MTQGDQYKKLTEEAQEEMLKKLDEYERSDSVVSTIMTQKSFRTV